MFGRKDIPDRELMRTITQRLSRTGTGSRIAAAVQHGTVTLSGNLQYAAQRIPIVKAASMIEGVRQVIDNMKFEQKRGN
jgi:osmotically-inducible protein OsmY